ncbi:diacylglycerol kinase [Paraburkholderia sp. RP-4-7]|jgi:diacylglycerol kinase (ATP)|uniref:Diacylglycerol kinase n=2 Tax=Paraburkholderia polaris TaxID=2728848 RepID=A0A848INY6_9BURK|nr:diacylglycerol kinase [Paraburkholderia polaris]
MSNPTRSSSAPSEACAAAQTSTPLPAKRSGPLRALFALRHSCDGMIATLREESAFRQEVALAAILLPCALLLPVSAIERVLLIVSVLLVLLVELLNSSIEAAIDRISLERHALSKRAKDCGSAAVTMALLICAVTWGVLCGPLVYHWLRAQI